ncbi:MAG TPA: transcriptional regulator [Clostridiales bacterium]|nr:transcriptional regulator [Clostridiales bacterium]
MNILKKINSMRLERGWSVYRLSVEANLPQSTMINMFNRETLPSLTTLESLCRAFGVSLSEFFREDGTPEPREEEAGRLFHAMTDRQAELVLSLMREFAAENKRRGTLAQKQE